MCATSGGGFALMTEAIGQAGMIECRWLLSRYNVVVPPPAFPQRRSRGLNQVFGASQGDFPRIIIAPVDTPTASRQQLKRSTWQRNISFRFLITFPTCCFPNIGND